MPRQPKESLYTRIHPYPTADTIAKLNSPIVVYSRCESSAFVRKALVNAINQNYLPVSTSLELGNLFQRSKDKLREIKSENLPHNAADAAVNLRNARVFFEQAHSVTDEVKPILYYYGGLSFFDFITHCIVRRERVGTPGHGLSVSCNSKGADFDEAWVKDKIHIEMSKVGDFPFYVDALTFGGWPSLFSSFRVHKESKFSLPEIRENPAPLLRGNKVSLHYLCNFDRDEYLRDNPTLADWLIGTDKRKVWRMTTLLLDFVVVFAASSLARYYIPAWKGIIEAVESPIFNDIRVAYNTVEIGVPYFFSDEHPFQSSFDTAFM